MCRCTRLILMRIFGRARDSALAYFAGLRASRGVQVNMQIFVRTLGGASLPLEVNPSTSVSAVKAAVEEHEYVPASLMRLNHGGLQLNSGSLAEAGVEEADTLTLLLNVNGGMRAKWRKKRMRRLRRKRRKMRQRAR